ncbi:MAG TPA: adenylate/guanylate cyclase domain-containing protein, partial [Methanothrix soehngenii]|nr:adenylate/guanylate cyclase domain-containing protein [Methanothrix soehngenii]
SCLVLGVPIATSAQSDLDPLLRTWNDPSLADTARLNAMYDLTSDISEPYPDSAIHYGQLGLEMAERIGSKEHMAGNLRVLGMANDAKGELARSLDLFQRSHDLYDEIGDEEGKAGVLYLMAMVHWTAGEYERAINHHRRSKTIAASIGDLDQLASCLYGIAYCYFELGQFIPAVDHVQQGLDINTKLGNEEGISWGLNAIGVIYSRQGEEEKALEYMLKALEVNERINDRGQLAYSLRNVASRYSDLGDHEKALEYYERSLAISEELNEKRSIALSLGSIGHLHKEMGELEEALGYFERSLQLSREIGNRGMEGEDLQDIGEVLLELGSFGQAIQNCRNSYDIALEIGSLEGQKYACKCLYTANKKMGKNTEALGFYELMHVLEDSLDTEATVRNLQEMEYEKELLADSLRAAEEKYEMELAHQQEVARKDKTRNMLMGGGILLLLIAGGLLGRNRFVTRSKKAIQKEKDRSEELLLNILPEEVAEELKETGRAAAKHFDTATILFTDFKGFTQLSEQVTPAELVEELNTCFKEFDHLMEKYGIEKIKTIGDAYMAAGGLPVPDEHAAKNTVMAGLAMQAFMKERKAEREAQDLPAFEMRLGIHTGPVVAGIVGVKKFQYDIWGDTVNTASRMESSGEVGQVNISEATY